MSHLLTLGTLQQVQNRKEDVELSTSLIKYGRLYTWAAATGGTLISGMTAATDAEWTTLTDYIDSEYNGSPDDFGVGNHLKHPRKNGTPVLSSEYNTSTHPRWDASETHYGRDTVKLGVLPGGRRIDTNGMFQHLGVYCWFWSSEVSSTNASCFSLYSDYGATPSALSINKAYGAILRVIRAATSGEQSTYNDGDVIEQVTDYDGNVYDCIRIGTQVWTKQNIATTKYTDGTSIPKVTVNDDWKDLSDTDKAYCDCNNNDSNTFFDSEEDSIW